MHNELQGDLYEAQINEEGHTALIGVAQWANIAAMIGLGSLAVNIVVLVVTMVRASGADAVSEVFGTLITTAISLLLNLTLLAAASKIKLGVEQADQEEFLLGLGKLTSYFKILGILTIIALVLMGLATIISLLFVGATAIK